jgi:GNAT superfamily N-acetyltransferase
MAELKYEVVDVNDKNLEEYGLFCQKSRCKEEGYKNKVKWFKEQHKKGLRVRLLGYRNDKGRFVLVGFVEYVPGEYSWRGVDAKGWMVIHCMWVIGKHKRQGLGSKLLEECVKDAKGMNGIVVVTSKKHWLPNEKLFVKNGFVKVDEMPSFELYAKKLKDNVALPQFNPISQKKLDSYGKGLTILESHQCPYSCKIVETIKKIAERAKIQVKVEHLSGCQEAQKNGVHPYGTFCVILNGKVVSYYPGDTKEVRQALKQ